MMPDDFVTNTVSPIPVLYRIKPSERVNACTHGNAPACGPKLSQILGSFRRHPIAPAKIFSVWCIRKAHHLVQEAASRSASSDADTRFQSLLPPTNTLREILPLRHFPKYTTRCRRPSLEARYCYYPLLLHTSIVHRATDSRNFQDCTIRSTHNASRACRKPLWTPLRSGCRLPACIAPKPKQSVTRR
jgi:hypothetical protein